MDENSVSFQTFLILLSCITLGSESQISVFKQCQSNTQMSWGIFFGGGACAEAKKALRPIQFFASFISLYFETLSYLACGKKIIRLASKNSVKLVEKSTSDF